MRKNCFHNSGGPGHVLKVLFSESKGMTGRRQKSGLELPVHMGCKGQFTLNVHTHPCEAHSHKVS